MEEVLPGHQVACHYVREINDLSSLVVQLQPLNMKSTLSAVVQIPERLAIDIEIFSDLWHTKITGNWLLWLFKIICL